MNATLYATIAFTVFIVVVPQLIAAYVNRRRRGKSAAARDF